MTVTEARQGLADRLATIPGLSAYANVPDQVVTPAAVIWPDRVDYLQAQGGSQDMQIVFRVDVIVSKVAEQDQQRRLDDLISPTGTQSIPATIEAESTLGGVADWATAARLIEYGQVEFGGTAYIGARMEVEVYG